MLRRCRRARLDGGSLVNREECSGRIHLVDEYSRLITEFQSLLESLKAPIHERNAEIWKAAEAAEAESEAAWKALEKHIIDHKCIDLPQQGLDLCWETGSGSILAKAALAAVDVILVADDDRQYVAVNEAAAEAFGLPRGEIVGRRIDEFFTTAAGETIPADWSDFLAAGTQRGIWEMHAPGRQRKFDYRSKANFSPGLHLSILREMTEDVES
jgi:PAS domain-containing protein